MARIWCLEKGELSEVSLLRLAVFGWIDQGDTGFGPQQVG